MKNFTIYSDNLIEADWFQSLSPKLQNAKNELIKERNKNIPIINELVDYDRPDIILLDQNKKPLLVLEKTAEVPTGHNVGQRIARLVKAIEKGIPTILFFPFDARKHGVHSGICNMNARLLLAFKRMWEIHNTPIFAINWKSDSNGELINDGSEDDELKNILKNLIENNFSLKSKIYKKFKDLNYEEYQKRISIRPAYAKPPKSAEIIKTKEFLESLDFEIEEDKKNILLKNEESLIYKIIMTEENCKRQDPYTGTQFMYDYLYCRTGKLNYEKKRNLFLYFPKIRKNTWKIKNPNNPEIKSCNWYLIANTLIFKDGILNLI